ncbi:low affinity immunoglobulin gamma Fc region receptor II-like [Sinocyclocheilus anshuiensis]|uniref:low affinity immunoglobulin gamma Fc region receptor II-like n=1 Tax=Sinocyclocheilus anshuiensis TaxID=1608454 RepID=UPI0007B997F6|nr:PREDICTED: low affinity immunoglobulin gamma Fc region receptor II-like [Sinocyclocheilus anshuiensis]
MELPLVLLLISNIHSGHTEADVIMESPVHPVTCSQTAAEELEETTLSFDLFIHAQHTHMFNMLLMSDFSISDRAQAVLSVSPQKWLTEGDPVTLICEVNGSSTGWTFSWFTVTVSDYRYRYELLSRGARGAGGNYTVSSAALKHTGVYAERAERGKPVYKRTISNTQLIWVTGVSPPVSLIISPSRTQHFTLVSLSLSCEDQSNSDRWRVRRYTGSGQWEDCSSLRRASQTGSTCTISSTITWDTGVYWCQFESGENSHPVNITVHLGVILESPVHPVTEGDTLTLRCLYQHSTPPNLRADFYKDGSLIQNQTTEMIISTVSKSHEGFYYCKHPERGESPKSWISVRASSASKSDGLNPVIIGVTAGLTVTFLIIVVLVLLWCYRNNKGVRSQSPSSVSQQQNSSQTSEQNQSDAGNNTLLSDSVSGPELTYAEIELKSTKKLKKKKDNKRNSIESYDSVYSKQKLETDQGAGSSDVTYAQIK